MRHIVRWFTFSPRRPVLEAAGTACALETETGLCKEEHAGSNDVLKRGGMPRMPKSPGPRTMVPSRST